MHNGHLIGESLCIVPKVVGAKKALTCDWVCYPQLNAK